MTSESVPAPPIRYNMIDRVRRIDTMLPPTFHEDMQLVVDELRHRFRLQAALYENDLLNTEREVELARTSIKQVCACSFIEHKGTNRANDGRLYCVLCFVVGRRWRS